MFQTARKDTSKFSINQKCENNNFNTFLTENNKTKNYEKQLLLKFCNQRLRAL
jgi:hypothetical protein